MSEPDRIIRLRTVLARTGLSRSTIYRKITEGTFPAQIKISINGAGWRESEVNQWIENPVAWRTEHHWLRDKRTPGPPPFSGMNSIPAASSDSFSTCRIESDAGFEPRSNCTIVLTLTLDRSAKSCWEMSRSPRAARTWAALTLIVQMPCCTKKRKYACFRKRQLEVVCPRHLRRQSNGESHRRAASITRIEARNMPRSSIAIFSQSTILLDRGSARQSLR